MRTYSMFATFALVSSSILGAQVSSASSEVLAILSDTDMVPTVYETGELGPIDSNYRDTLSVTALPIEASRRPSAIEVSNSTNGPPGALDLSGDGRFAYVAETFRERPPGATRLAQLPPGNTIRSLRLRDGRPAFVDVIEIGTQPRRSRSARPAILSLRSRSMLTRNSPSYRFGKVVSDLSRALGSICRRQAA